MTVKSKPKDPSATRRKLLDAAVALMRRQGFSATTVDQICTEAGVTKGAFFHHFQSKEDIGESAVLQWCAGRAEGYRAHLEAAGDDPLEQLDRLLEGLAESARNPPDDLLVCLLGMVSQELGATHERMRRTCAAALDGWTGFVAQLLEAAKKIHPVRVEFDPEHVGWLFNSLWQGSLLVAKTRRDPEIVVRNLEHARAYVATLFAPDSTSGSATKKN
jgi:TetR/AcrR family transcriptional regulator, transcriptional repressor for nem operon